MRHTVITEQPSAVSTFLWPVFLFTLLSCLFCYQIFLTLNNWAGGMGAMDWDVHTSLIAGVRETILRYHQFPLWNPYSYGGTPLLGHPYAVVLSPFNLLILAFGPVVGGKLNMVLHMIIGLVGMFVLSRHLGMGRLSSYFSSFIFMFSSWFPLHYSAGHYAYLNTVFIPFAVLFYLKAITDGRFSILSGGTLTLMMFDGAPQIVAMTGLLILFHSFLWCFKERRLDATLALVFTGLFLALFSAIQVFPLYFDILSLRPRQGWLSDAYPFTAVFTWLLDRNQYLLSAHFPAQHYPWNEYGAYTGIIPLLLYILGSLFLFRRLGIWVLTSVLFLLLSLGNFYSLAPWTLLHHLPIFGQTESPSRYRILFIFCFAIIAGLTLSRLEKLKDSRITYTWRGVHKSLHLNVLSSLACWGITVYVLLDLFLVDSRVLEGFFTIPPLQQTRQEIFRQVANSFQDSEGRYITAMFLSVLNNEGSIIGHGRLDWHPSSMRPYGSPQYRGEAYLLNNRGKAVISSWSPNRLVIQVDLPESEEDTLVINQRMWRGWGWKAEDGRPVTPQDLLISTHVTGRDKEVVLSYRPWSVRWGALTTFLGCGIAVIVWRGVFLTRFTTNLHRALTRIKRHLIDFFRFLFPIHPNDDEEGETVIDMSRGARKMKEKFRFYLKHWRIVMYLLGLSAVIITILLVYRDLVVRISIVETNVIGRLSALENRIVGKSFAVDASQEFERWSKMGGVTVQPNVKPAPDGTITADLIEGSSYAFSRSANGQYTSSGVFQHVSVGKVAEIPFTFSVWLQAPAPTIVELRINDTIKNYDNDNILVTATPQWEKFSVTYTFPSSSQSTTVRLQVGTPEGKPVLAWGASLEVKPTAR